MMLKPRLLHNDFREIDLEVEGFLTVGQLMDDLADLAAEGDFLGRIGLVEVERFEVFEPLKELLVEQSFFDAQ